ncbi:MAG: alanine--tRNA ligase [Defluviitaleaceae bacterium]|nr:alanine--tRNA ligase [Defluviitaleaceae bacterium]MCL2261861.1 alanine--tRNA ligase [Defluviitaleaceae bacterium]
MKFQTVDQIRDNFLDFFVGKEHYLLPSFPLVPQGDKSLLLINSGMAPMKAFFTGQETPPSKRVTTCQKCIRTIDIDEVGKDARHASFFEMLGMFSFGDYFKKEVIPWAWEFFTETLEIPKDKLSISVYEEDDEAYAIWRDDIGIPTERIFRLDKKENFWEHGVGPCGPCSEIHFDRGAESGCGKPTCTVGCDCDRFMEIGNLVFTQFEKQEDGTYTPLAFPNIDVGIGLERLAIVLQDAHSIFDIDNVKSIRDKVLTMAKAEPTGSALVSANIIADHVRSVAFMASDGVLPSNEGRGYVFRRLLRRAVRHGKSLGLTRFVCDIAQTAINAYSHAYPSLEEKSGHILNVLENEENRFLETLDTGMNLLQKHIDALKSSGAKTLSGEDAFKLYDTFGFPPDLTREILEDNGLSWDENGFKAEMENQKTRARAARGTSTYMGADETVYHKLTPDLPTEFIGYTENSCDSAEVLAIIANGTIAQTAAEGQEVAVVLNRTPFYATSGGQRGDKGKLFANGAEVKISDCITVAGNNIVHMGVVKTGAIKIGQKVSAEIDGFARLATERNHTAAHLLQKALRSVLGDHVEQAGSAVDASRLRFDFTHMKPLTPKEREKVESLVCDYIAKAFCVTTEVTTPDEARKKGALALFGEKYGDTVRMVNVGNESIELCGGTHVKNTSEIGVFRIVSETGVASGVRRIEAETGRVAISRYQSELRDLTEAAEVFKIPTMQLPEKAKSVFAEIRDLKRELGKIQAATVGEQQGQVVENILESAETVNGFTLISAKMENYDMDALRKLCDKLKAEMKSGCMILCGTTGETGAAQFLASATDDAVKAGADAGRLVSRAAKICGGGGGGKPNHAQAGGKDASRADEALAQALIEMKAMIE